MKITENVEHTNIITTILDQILHIVNTIFYTPDWQIEIRICITSLCTNLPSIILKINSKCMYQLPYFIICVLKFQVLMFLQSMLEITIHVGVEYYYATPELEASVWIVFRDVWQVLIVLFNFKVGCLSILKQFCTQHIYYLVIYISLSTCNSYTHCHSIIIPPNQSFSISFSSCHLLNTILWNSRRQSYYYSRLKDLQDQNSLL